VAKADLAGKLKHDQASWLEYPHKLTDVIPHQCLGWHVLKNVSRVEEIDGPCLEAAEIPRDVEDEPAAGAIVVPLLCPGDHRCGDVYSHIVLEV